MRLKLYCNRYEHFKDALVCSVNCAYRTRCHDFALFYDEHRDGVDAQVACYFAARREAGSSNSPSPTPRALPVVSAAPVAGSTTPMPVRMGALIFLEVKRNMAEAAYIWIDKEDRAELIESEEVLRRAERGLKAKHIFKVSQEMELRFQLVPRKRIDKAKRAAEVERERASARRIRAAKTPALSLASSLPDTATNEALTPATAAAPRRGRARSVKAAGGR